LLVNACAGSGKTTIFILMALVAVSKGIVNTDEILGVTFSHKSKEDMTARYRKYVSELANVGLTYSTEEPKFTTFHSLFFHLLTCNEEYQGVRVVSSYKEYQRSLERVMAHPDPVMTKRQMLKQMFRLNNYLICCSQSGTACWLMFPAWLGRSRLPGSPLVGTLMSSVFFGGLGAFTNSKSCVCEFRFQV